MSVSFGIETSQMGVTYDQIRRVWREADAIEHASLWDHLVPLRGDAGALEAWTLLAAMAAQTSRLRLGVMVTSNRLRAPTLLAQMAATVDVIAGGRLDFGIGAGRQPGGGASLTLRGAICAPPPGAAAETIGRDPATIIRSMQLIVRAAEPGAAAKTRAAIGRMVDAGVQHIVLATVFGDHGVQWLAEEVLAHVKPGRRIGTGNG